MPVADASGSGAKTSSLSTDAGKTKSGDKKKANGKGADFDESKVKRDGFGKFAKKASTLSYIDQIKMDNEWATKTLSKFKKKFEESLAPGVNAIAERLMRKHGFATKEAANAADPKSPAAKAYRSEVMSEFVKYANEQLKSHSEAVSPTGNQRLEYYVHDDPIVGTVVDSRIVGLVDTTASNAAADRAVKKIRKSRTKSNGLEFNPNASIDSGRVQDIIHKLKLDEDGGFVAHKEQTIQDLLDNASQGQRDTVEAVVGAAVEDEGLADFPDIVAAYDELPIEMKFLIDFIVGSTMAEDEFMHNAELMVGNFLAQSGVKGMRWGIRKSESEARADRRGGTDTRLSKSPFNTPADRAAARAAIKTGQANLLAAHVAALKSTGHRVTNGVLGDKTFWKRTAVIAGATYLGIQSAGLLVPALLPASTLSSIGATAAHQAGYIVLGNHIVAASATANSLPAVTAMSTLALGKTVVAGISVAAAGVTGAAAQTGNYANNVVRAIRGNARIDASATALGKNLLERQTAGNARTRKILSRNGGIAKRDLEPEKPASARRGLGQELALMGAGAAITKMAQSDDFESFTLIGQSDILDNFLAHQGIDRDNVMRGDVQLIEDFIEHHGIKGMRWGVRRPDGPDGTVSSGAGTKKPVADVNKDGKPDHIAIDAVRFAESREKSLHEMSTKELKEANARAQAIKQYNEMFTPGSQANSALQARVNELKLQKEYRSLQAELAPPSKIQGFISTAQKGYAGFAAVDKMMDGQLSAGLTKKLGLVPPPSKSELKKLELDDLKLSKDIVVAKGELNEVTALSKHIADPTSLAAGYPYAGKRAAMPDGSSRGGARKIGTFNAQSLGNQGPALPREGSGYKINKDGSFQTVTTKAKKGSRMGLPKSGDGYKINRDGSFQATGRHKAGKHKK